MSWRYALYDHSQLRPSYSTSSSNYYDYPTSSAYTVYPSSRYLTTLYDHSSVRPSYSTSSSHYDYPTTTSSSSSYYDYPSTSSSSQYLSRIMHQPSNMDYSQQKTTGRQLQRLIYYSAVPCRLRSTECAIYDVDCDEVFYGVYIGDAAAAKNKEYLRAMGITHVLNAAEGTKYGQVDTGHIYYRDMPKLRYMGFQVIDQINSDISRYFYLAAKFIENALNSGGKVLVHCLVGMSRSATCVIAYLMICRKMSAAEAIRKIRMRRSIRPNDGFLQQLADLDNELRSDRERHHY